MTEEMYEQIKTALIDHEHLFAKLLKVANEYDAIDFDESGFYQDDVERCERHWNTLASKLRNAVAEAVESAEVKLMKNREPNIRSLRFEIITPTEEEGAVTSFITVDYATSGQIAIDRQSV